MTRPTLARLALTLLAFGSAGASCPIGPSSVVVEDATARVLVTGLLGTETVTVTLGDVERAAPADGERELTFFLELEPADYTGRVRIDDGVLARCAEIDLQVGDGEDAAVTSVNAVTALPCEEIIDVEVRLFVRFEEIVATDPCIGPCEVRTTVEADGSVSLVDLALPVETGVVDAPTLEGFTDDALDDEADALFAGDDPVCPQPRPGGAVIVNLRRVFEIDDGESVREVDETVDVSGCDDGEASRLRDALEGLRVDALGL